MNTKEKYEKPQLEMIELKADEVLAIGCKTASGSAVLGPPNCGFASGCVTVGS